jgi:hypothetical protein
MHLKFLKNKGFQTKREEKIDISKKYIEEKEDSSEDDETYIEEEEEEIEEKRGKSFKIFIQTL